MTPQLIKELGITLNMSPLPPVNYSNLVCGQVLGWAYVPFHIGLVSQQQCVRVMDVLPASCVIGTDSIRSFCLQQNKDLSISQDLGSIKIAINYVNIEEGGVTIASISVNEDRCKSYLMAGYARISKSQASPQCYFVHRPKGGGCYGSLLHGVN